MHGGITKVPIADYYPEYDATKGPGDISGNRAETLTVANAWYTPYQSYNFTYWQIQAYAENIVTVDNTQCVPFAFIYVFTEYGATKLAEGTYPFTTTLQPGTAYAGFRDDEEMMIEGSMFYFTSYSYLQQGYIVPSAQWLITDGELTITKTGWSVSGHARNGADIKLEGTTPITNQGKASAPAKMPKKDARTCANEEKAVSLHANFSPCEKTTEYTGNRMCMHGIWRRK